MFTIRLVWVWGVFNNIIYHYDSHTNIAMWMNLIAFFLRFSIKFIATKNNHQLITDKNFNFKNSYDDNNVKSANHKVCETQASPPARDESCILSQSLVPIYETQSFRVTQKPWLAAAERARGWWSRCTETWKPATWACDDKTARSRVYIPRVKQSLWGILYEPRVSSLLYNVERYSI